MRHSPDFKETTMSRFTSTGRRHLCAGAAAVGLVAAASIPAMADGANHPRTLQTADVIDMTALPAFEFTGAGWLERSKNELRGRVMTKVEHAGFAYTVWWVIFNHPSECSTSPCNPDDLGNPAVAGAVFYGNGAISAADGNGGGVINVDVETVARGIAEGTFRLDDTSTVGPIFFADGLKRGNGFDAEIHLVVDEHFGPNDKSGTESWLLDLTTTDFPDPPGTLVQDPETVLGVVNSRVVVFMADAP
jgi:hypothetical protein